jgi:5-methylcytosine-specific restriction endonuclease McrA
MDSKISKTRASTMDLYEFYETIKWLGSIRVHPGRGGNERWIYENCNLLHQKGLLNKEKLEEGVFFSVTKHV